MSRRQNISTKMEYEYEERGNSRFPCMIESAGIIFCEAIDKSEAILLKTSLKDLFDEDEDDNSSLPPDWPKVELYSEQDQPGEEQGSHSRLNTERFIEQVIKTFEEKDLEEQEKLELAIFRDELDAVEFNYFQSFYFPYAIITLRVKIKTEKITNLTKLSEHYNPIINVVRHYISKIGGLCSLGEDNTDCPAISYIGGIAEEKNLNKMNKIANNLLASKTKEYAGEIRNQWPFSYDEDDRYFPQSYIIKSDETSVITMDTNRWLDANPISPIIMVISSKKDDLIMKDRSSIYPDSDNLSKINPLDWSEVFIVPLLIPSWLGIIGGRIFCNEEKLLTYTHKILSQDSIDADSKKTILNDLAKSGLELSSLTFTENDIEMTYRPLIKRWSRGNYGNVLEIPMFADVISDYHVNAEEKNGHLVQIGKYLMDELDNAAKWIKNTENSVNAISNLMLQLEMKNQSTRMIESSRKIEILTDVLIVLTLLMVIPVILDILTIEYGIIWLLFLGFIVFMVFAIVWKPEK